MIERMLESWAEGETPASVLRMQTNSEHLLTMRDQPEDYARLVGTFSSTRPHGSLICCVALTSPWPPPDRFVESVMAMARKPEENVAEGAGIPLVA